MLMRDDDGEPMTHVMCEQCGWLGPFVHTKDASLTYASHGREFSIGQSVEVCPECGDDGFEWMTREGAKTYLRGCSDSEEEFARYCAEAFTDVEVDDKGRLIL